MKLITFAYDQAGVEAANAWLADNDSKLLANSGVSVFADRLVLLYTDVTLEERAKMAATNQLEASIIDMTQIIGSQEANRRFEIGEFARTGLTVHQTSADNALAARDEICRKRSYHQQVRDALIGGEDILGDGSETPVDQA